MRWDCAGEVSCCCGLAWFSVRGWDMGSGIKIKKGGVKYRHG